MTLNKNDLVSILDGDTIPYLVAYNFRDKEDVDEVLVDTDNFVSSILASTSCTHYVGFLGGTKCFRYDIAVTKPYKGNRPESPDWYKKWGGVIKAHLRDKWKFVVVNGIEADDAVAIAAFDLRLQEVNYIVCGADKDLLQIVGNHYNIRTHTRQYIDKAVASRNLFKQILIGDTADNILGLPGIGPKKASGFIDRLDDWQEMATIVCQLFENKYKDGGKVYREMYDLCYLLELDKTMNIEYNKIERIGNEPMNDILTELFG